MARAIRIPRGVDIRGNRLEPGDTKYIGQSAVSLTDGADMQAFQENQDLKDREIVGMSSPGPKGWVDNGIVITESQEEAQNIATVVTREADEIRSLRRK